MAPPVDELSFILLCIKHSPLLTPNFEAVASEGGSITPNGAYHRLYAMRKKYGLPMNERSGSGRKASSASPKVTTGASGGGKKRGRPAKTASETNYTEFKEEEQEQDEAKPEHEEESEEVESPTKKAKIDDAEVGKPSKKGSE